MTRKRRVFGAAFRAKVALEAVRGQKTTAELASQYKVHSSQVSAWKKQLLDHVAELFADGRSRAKDDSSADESELFEQIGRLKMELEWSKKKSAELS
jgi:transposase-like protein